MTLAQAKELHRTLWAERLEVDDPEWRDIRVALSRVVRARTDHEAGKYVSWWERFAPDERFVSPTACARHLRRIWFGEMNAGKLKGDKVE